MPSSSVRDNSTCGPDSFMLRDGVCDDVANIALCLFDGGDCCHEFKNKVFCKNCSCVLKVVPGELRAQLKSWDVRPLTRNDTTGIVRLSPSSVVNVSGVLTKEVCAVLCIGHERADEINTWQYNEHYDSSCTCGWIGSEQCPEHALDVKIMTLDLDLLTVNTTFIQMNKTIPCGKLKQS